MKDQSDINGILILLLNSLIVSFFGVFTRLLLPYMGGFFQIGIVFAIVAIILLPFMLRSKIIPKQYWMNWKFLILIISFPIYVVFFTISVSKIPISNAFFYNFSSSLIVSIIIGRFFFKEEISQRKLIVLALLISGLGFYAFPFRISNSVYGILTGLLAGTFTAISNATRKYFTNKINSWSIIYMQMVFGAALGFALAFFTEDSWNFAWTFTPILITLLYVTGNITVPYILGLGFKLLKMNFGAIILSSQLIFVPIWAYLFFHETPSLNEIVGVIILLISILFLNLFFTEE